MCRGALVWRRLVDGNSLSRGINRLCVAQASPRTTAIFACNKEAEPEMTGTSPDRARSDILVTGAAGFIGFHVAQRLLQMGHRVTGLDSVNDYYDPALKEARLQLLRNHPLFVF